MDGACIENKTKTFNKSRMIETVQQTPTPFSTTTKSHHQHATITKQRQQLRKRNTKLINNTTIPTTIAAP
eukprot:m.18346 g.18346  ORF g.18346 m.18346 type:complete len:70 (-) comp11961_c1_seq1:55-264(-)